MNTTKSLIATVAASAMIVGSAHAGVLASTDFDGRTLTQTTVAGDTATNLDWTLNGLEDPGNMLAKNAGGGAQTIFDSTADSSRTKNNFTPLINTGNGNTFWTTDVAITVASGFAVTLEDVKLDVVSINGGASLNVNRKNDFTLTLLNPSGGTVEAITIADILSGTSADPNIPTVTFDFADVALNLPGTYILRIKGGDFTGDNETGNHTGIDNLSINGTVVPEPSSLALLALGGLLVARRRRD